MNQSVIDALKEMRFSAMAAEFERQLNDAATYTVLGFEERFSLLVEAERNRRQQNNVLFHVILFVRFFLFSSTLQNHILWKTILPGSAS